MSGIHSMNDRTLLVIIGNEHEPDRLKNKHTYL